MAAPSCSRQAWPRAPRALGLGGLPGAPRALGLGGLSGAPRALGLGGWALRALCLGAWPVLLAGQSLPTLPSLDLAPPASTVGELLPLRPAHPKEEGEGSVPLRVRGKNIMEDADGWTLQEGAVESPDLLLLADHIRYNTTTGEMAAEGHIRLEGPGLRMRCASLRMNWLTRIGEAHHLELELPPTWVLRSDKVAFATLKHWDFDQVELSPCPQEIPGWRAQVSKLTVDLDDYATLRNLWLWVGSMPTYYYLPWAMYPAKAERTSGLLPITPGLSSNMGAYLSVPYYQVLGPTADATLAPTWYARQGVLWAGETRWNPEPTHAGSVSGEFIHQHQDGLSRYRYSAKELWQREDGWQLSADLNGATDSLLDADYGSGVSRLGTTSFDSAVFVGKNYPWASVNFTANQQRTFFLPQDTSFYDAAFPTSLKRTTLPSLQSRVYPIPLGPFYFDAGLQVSRLSYALDLGDPNPGPTYNWGREDVFARMQGRLGQWGPFRADLQTMLRDTRYSATLGSNAFGGNAANGEPLDSANPTVLNPFSVNGPSADRLLGSARLLLSAPPVGRTFQDLHVLGYSGEVKHLVNPYFAFTENSVAGAQGYLPHFDEVDDAPGVNNSAAGEESFELGMKQHFLGRGLAGTPFTDLVRWTISARYHFRPILLSDGLYKKGWASLDNALDVEPNDRVRISFRRSSDVTDSSADDSLSADLRMSEGSRLNLAYFSTGINPYLVRQKGLQLGFTQRLWDDRVRLESLANYDFQTRAFSSSQVAIAYLTPCVAWSLRYSHVALGVTDVLTKEDRLDLVLTLRALGDLTSLGF